MNTRPLNHKQSFRIYKDNLSAFLVVVDGYRATSNGDYYVAENIFQNGLHYDVVVAEYGDYPYCWNTIVDSAKQLENCIAEVVSA